jgi:hypothetical protein
VALTEPDEWTEGTLADRAKRLHLLSLVAAKVDELTEEINDAIAADMEADLVEVPGIGVLQRDKATSSTWRFKGANDQMREDLANAVARDIATDEATGEIDPMKRNIALAALRIAYEAIPSFSSINKAGARRLGLYVSDYREFSERDKVKLVVK